MVFNQDEVEHLLETKNIFWVWLHWENLLISDGPLILIGSVSLTVKPISLSREENLNRYMFWFSISDISSSMSLF